MATLNVESSTVLDVICPSVARLGSLPDWADTITKVSMLPTHSQLQLREKSHWEKSAKSGANQCKDGRDGELSDQLRFLFGVKNILI